MAERSGPPLLPRHGTFDLFLTRTDFHGWPRHLPVSPRFAPDPLYERTHAHWMWFRRRPPQTAESNGGFDERDADFALTHATRSTAGSPLAFAPVSYDDLALDFHKARPDDAVPPAGEFYRRHLPEHRLARVPGEARSEHGWSRHAWMIDGGLLDNRPFSYVADAIERKPADHEVFRIVMYVEPDPEPDLELSPPDPPPSMAIAKGLFKLFRHEPIYADLARLDERNSKVRR